ncbi:hypothetical protein [Stenotrophomonas sp. PS02301]|uniref:hypothetical protein n=1 Tax=Stenotrophomonas sp. PS02301 TaxID=2991427 RepID=UPI00249A84FF|nr:hypothetical protein [Stenotrophomonas sp. PS02301]
MEVDDWTGLKRDRMFEPRRVPFSPAAKALVAHVQARMEAVEERTRTRKAVDQAIFERTVVALVSDLIATAPQDENRWTSVEMSNQKLTPAKRRADFMTERFPEVVRLLADERLALVELRTAPPGTRHGLQSTMRALPGLLQEVREAGLTSTDFRTTGRQRKKNGAVLELRGRKVPVFKGGQWTVQAPRLELPDTDEVRLLRDQMEEINAWLNTAKLDFFSEPDIDIHMEDRVMKRVFNDGSLEKRGRLYGGFWQQMGADDRLTDIAWGHGEEADATASLDFGQSSIRMAYAEV